MANKTEKTNKKQLSAIDVLGRKPRAPFIVKTRCADGSPQVLLADTVFKEEGIYKPFPTFLWLVCPILKHKVAQLEESGLIKELSELLQINSDLKSEFDKGQSFICKIRVEIAEKILKNQVPKHIYKVLGTTTIAGSSNYTGVKCLHAHLAQELVYGNNPLGRIVLEKTGTCNGEHQKGHSND
ncbi:MAG: DUF501 domain-containing protein [Candidatus Rifleibacteriota bacterium]